MSCTFPGEWDTPPNGGTCRIFHLCRCPKCTTDWDCPLDVSPGDWLKVADMHGVYPARVVKTEWSPDPDCHRVSIESDDPNAPEYLRKKVHSHWWISRRNSLWMTWIPCPQRATLRIAPTRFEREDVCP